MRLSRRTCTVSAIALASLLAGCATWNEMDKSEKGMAAGATGGALVGAAVGGPPGAVVGAAVGGYAGHHEGPRHSWRTAPSAPADYSVSAPAYTYPSRYYSDNTPSSYTVYSYPSYSRSSSASGYYYTYPATDADVIRDAQLALRDRGYRPGVIDGVWGPNTHAAVREFQRTQRLAMTGTLDQSTLEALGVQP